MEFEERYRQLNARQQEAVDTIDGPVMVIAGPGTGKTELLSVRVANILKKTDTLPENILCLTFTESGASAMRERLVGIIGKDAYKVAIHTFHSFGTEIINQNREYFYRGAMFEPADDISRYEILRGIFDELDYKNPLSSMMNDEYTHQYDSARVISELKRSGLTSDELLAVLEEGEKAIDEAEKIIVPIISGTISKTTREKLSAALPEVMALANSTETLYEVTPLARTIADGLALAVNLSETEHPTKPITAWKKKWFTKNEKGEFTFKSRAHITKLRALSFVYYEYLVRMEQAGLYDYDDMILQVVHAMEVHDDLRFNLQEKYLYIMVDEFQDTNLAQMRILHNLTSNQANEGTPNIMVVGDDDQAIYSFQGADISNIMRLRELYPALRMIVLGDNYRSKKQVISSAREVITQGADRLESIDPKLNKQLSAHKAGDANVEIYQAESIDDERHWLAETIARAIKDGTKPAEIAVLTRRHSEIQSLLPYFHRAGVPVAYERQDNILSLPPIVALEQISKVILALGRGEHDLANSLMPQLLAHPAFGIAPTEIWRLSCTAYDARQRWLDTMASLPQFSELHTWLSELAAASLSSPLEPLIDRIIGRTGSDVSETPSPLYEYYFGGQNLEEAPDQYLVYLDALRSIRSQLREFHPRQDLTLQSLIDFLALHRRIGSTLLIRRAGGNDAALAVNLMTAHKSKGLEFESVYIFNATDATWGEKARSASRNINYPENLPLAPAGESADERLRLFYVAMTRAKSNLTMSFAQHDDRDRGSLIASFLAESELPVRQIPPLDAPSQIEAAETAWFTPLVEPSKELRELLAPALKSYKLSVTHLNAFLDVTRGGPQAFLLDNLLHFPSTKGAAAAYGSAIHRTLQQAHIHLSATGELKPVEDVLKDFETNLNLQRLSSLDLATYLQKGSEQLQAFLAARYASFTPTQKTELNFAGQTAMLGEAHLTGMIDVADVDTQEKTMAVADYKTGKPSTSWNGRDEFEKIKLHKYRQQLLFYKLLVEHSRDYSSYKVTGGRLDFIEPTKSGEIALLETGFQPDELERLKELIQAVWRCITTLELPDVSHYEPTLKGILAFEQDLIDGTTVS